jgi:urea transporter
VKIQKALLNSYSQLFFSQNKWFAILLAASTFINWKIGAAGLICLLSAIVVAISLGHDKHYIEDGTYTFNSLMTGMALAIYFQPNLPFLFLLIICGGLSLFISLWLINWTSRRALPLLSWTFILVTWIAVLGASNFTAFKYISNDITQLSNSPLNGIMGDIDGWLNQLPMFDLLKVYLRSLGAIMFQYSTLAGILIFIGLLIYSRIATLLSILGFFIGFLFYSQFEGDFTQLIFSYIGFNFILTSIALGGFFIVPSWKSFLLVTLTIPVMALLISALSKFFAPFGLPLFSFPFCILVTLTLITLSLRVDPKKLFIVTNQQFSPEENHYKTILQNERFGNQSAFHLALPIMGEWHISQGYNGGITHLDEWQHALDFDIINDDNSTYQNDGTKLQDFNCYELPIIAPAAGYIVKVLDNIEDNTVGDVNLHQNWGNTVIIKHAEGFYTKLSHLKIDTIKVKEGDYVSKGDKIAKLGNSGRSPEPHLHFQLQTTPFIGSKTLPYPIAYYLKKERKNYSLQQFNTPKEGDKIKNLTPTTLLVKAFNFIPGQTISWESENEHQWDVLTNALNQSYLYCKKTKSAAYFSNNGNVFYFTDFIGDKSSSLFYFHLGLQKVLLSYYKNIVLNDNIHLKYLAHPIVKAIHDIIAPFTHIIKCKFESNYSNPNDEISPTKITLKSEGKIHYLGKEKIVFEFNCLIDTDKITNFNISINGEKKHFICSE